MSYPKHYSEIYNALTTGNHYDLVCRCAYELGKESAAKDNWQIYIDRLLSDGFSVTLSKDKKFPFGYVNITIHNNNV